MAKSFTPQDAHALMNLLVRQATGQEDIDEVDSSNFASAGEEVLSTGVENTLNALSIILGETLISVRPYQAKLKIINALNTNLYSSRLRKISYYARETTASGDWNTNLYTNLKDGFDNGKNPDAQGDAQSTASMWEQNQPLVLERNFGGQNVWEESTTVYKNQLKVAFRDEESFIDFINGILTEKANDIERQKEAFNRLVILNHIASVYDCQSVMAGSCVNLTKAFNDKFDTSYTSEELRTTYLTQFLEFFTSEFKLASDYMTESTAKYHWPVSKTVDGVSYSILRHTPKKNQRALLYAPLFVESESMVFPEIFNKNYLFDANQYELVNYWQSINSPSAIDVTPAIPDITGVSKTQTAGDEVELPYIVGLLYDEEAILTDFQLEESNTTPLEARKRFYNIWWTFSKNVISDITENTILFYMKDPDPEPEPEPEPGEN